MMNNVMIMLLFLGKMSQHLDSLSIGDSIQVRGPVGRLQYKRNGNKFTFQDP